MAHQPQRPVWNIDSQKKFENKLQIQIQLQMQV